MATKWKGGAADFLKPSVCKGGIEHLCLATTSEKAKDDDGAVCKLVAPMFVWSLQAVMDLFVPPALELALEKSMTLCHGRCVQGVTESSRACAWWLLNDAMLCLGAIAAIKCWRQIYVKLCLAGAVKSSTCNGFKMRSELAPRRIHQRLTCGISRVGVGHGALLLRVGRMRCSVGGVGVGRETLLPRVGRLRCSVGRDNSRWWALLPGSGGMWRGVGGNGTGRGATSLFVGGASYGSGVTHGASRGISRFGVAQALYGTLPPLCDATLKWRALAHEALLLLSSCNGTFKCHALAHKALSLFGAINMMEGLMLCLLGAMCCALVQVQMVKCWHKPNEMLRLCAVKSLRYTNVTNDVILRLIAFLPAWYANEIAMICASALMQLLQCNDVKFCNHAPSAITVALPAIWIVKAKENQNSYGNTIRGSGIKIGGKKFAPNAIFRVMSCLYILYDLTCLI
jgi:hypothetical protein